MSRNGYRLFAVSLHDNQKPDEQPFDKAQARVNPDTKVAPPAVNYLDEIENFFSTHQDTNFNIGLGEDVEDDEAVAVASRSGSSTRLGKVEVKARSARMWFTSGPIHREGTLADPRGNEVDQAMVGRSTLNDYRALLVTTPGGPRAVLAVETRGASCPVRPLVRALTSASDVPWRLRVHDALADAAALKSFIANGTVVEAELTEWTFDADGARSQKLKGLYSRVRMSDQDKAKKRIQRWRKSGKSTDVSVWKDEADEVKGAFYAKKVNLKFNDVAFTVENGGQERTFKPSTNFDRFTYQLHDSARVNDDDFFKAVRDSAKLLIKDLQPA